MVICHSLIVHGHGHPSFVSLVIHGGRLLPWVVVSLRCGGSQWWIGWAVWKVTCLEVHPRSNVAYGFCQRPTSDIEWWRPTGDVCRTSEQGEWWETQRLGGVMMWGIKKELTWTFQVESHMSNTLKFNIGQISANSTLFWHVASFQLFFWFPTFTNPHSIFPKSRMTPPPLCYDYFSLYSGQSPAQCWVTTTHSVQVSLCIITHSIQHTLTPARSMPLLDSSL